jgi:excinuclease ABC subunit A
MANRDSITGQSLRAVRSYPSRGARRPVVARGGSKTPMLVLERASLRNLKNLSASIPLGRFVCVTGVSGSGKSTLVRECLLPALREKLKNPAAKGAGPVIVSGHESIQAVYEVDQQPIGRTPRSIPATYAGFMDDIRRLFAELPEARMRGYSASRFSFNSPQGRCPECQGAGTVKLEMSFMPPAFVRCESCGGARFDRATLDIEYRGLNMARVLDLTVAQALDFFGAFQKIARPLQALCDTGLGYIRLGQTSPTLSGGEAQRLKLVAHLLTGFGRKPDLLAAGKPQGRFFILEEPTIGLHMADVRKLVDALQRLVDAGHTVLVIEHNLDLIAEADWVIDLGPEGGAEGGRIVAQGTPERIAEANGSSTGEYLKRLFRRPAAAQGKE